MSQPRLNASQHDDVPPPRVTVYTDGGCDPNPGPGGWGAILRWEGREWLLSGNDPSTTNNRMELQAAAAALALLEGLLGRCRVDLHTDSEYLRLGITEWIDGWIRRDWRTSGDTPVQNQDLWRTLHRLTEAHTVVWHWLKGHAGHLLNERADRLATEARQALVRGREQADQEPEAGDDRPAVDIYVKASCHGVRGRGGWGAVLRMDEHTKTLQGDESSTTANAMLIRGAAAALGALTRPCQVTVHSDAKYLVNGASSWVRGWQARGWQTRDGNPVANQAEWQALLDAARPHRVTWRLVSGEAIPEELDRAGELAGQAAAPAATET
jgi:ribonuclease HI